MGSVGDPRCCCSDGLFEPSERPTSQLPSTTVVLGLTDYAGRKRDEQELCVKRKNKALGTMDRNTGMGGVVWRGARQRGWLPHELESVRK